MRGLFAILLGISILAWLQSQQAKGSLLHALLGAKGDMLHDVPVSILQIAAVSLISVGLFNTLSLLFGSSFGLNPQAGDDSQDRPRHNDSSPHSSAAFLLSQARLAPLLSGALTLLAVAPAVVQTSADWIIKVDTHTPIASPDLTALHTSLAQLTFTLSKYSDSIGQQLATISSEQQEARSSLSNLTTFLNDCRHDPGLCVHTTVTYAPSPQDPIAVQLSSFASKLEGLSNQLASQQAAINELKSVGGSLSNVLSVAVGTPKPGAAVPTGLLQQALMQEKQALEIRELTLLSQFTERHRNAWQRLKRYFTGVDHACVLNALNQYPDQDLGVVMEKAIALCSQQQSPGTGRPLELDPSASSSAPAGATALQTPPATSTPQPDAINGSR